MSTHPPSEDRDATPELPPHPAEGASEEEQATYHAVLAGNDALWLTLPLLSYQPEGTRFLERRSCPGCKRVLARPVALHVVYLDRQPEAPSVAIPQAYASWRDFGATLRRCRNSHGLSRKELAKQLRLAASTIRNLEQGRHEPTRETLRLLQAAPRFACLFTAKLPPRKEWSMRNPDDGRFQSSQAMEGSRGKKAP